MFQDKYVFAQLTEALNRTLLNSYVYLYDGYRYMKHLSLIVAWLLSIMIHNRNRLNI